jgi:predicted nucleic acid-binding protein
VCHQVTTLDRSKLSAAIGSLPSGTMAEVEAARLGLRLGLPMADSLILATARAHGATLWTQDADFDGVDGVRFVPAVRSA